MALQINLNQMYFFYMVALHKGVRKAAKFLHVSPPAVSAQLKRLEENLGFPLIVRVNGKFSLTRSGEKLFPEVEKLFLQAQQLEEQISQLHATQESTLELGAHFLHLQCIIPKLMPYLSGMKKHLSVHLTAEEQDKVLQQLKNKEIHVGLLEHHPYENGLYIKELVSCETALLVCADNPLGRDGPISIHDLENVPLLLPRKDSGFATYLQEYFVENNFIPKYSEEYSLPINRRFLPHSKYAAFFPGYYLDHDINIDVLRKVKLKETLPELQLYYAYAQQSSFAENIQNFLQVLPSPQELLKLLNRA